MQAVAQTAISGWVQFESGYVPSSVDINCPHCGRLCNFPFQEGRSDNNRRAASFSSRCAGCRQAVYFWLIGPSDRAPGRGVVHRVEHLFVFPPGNENCRQPIPGIDRVPDSIRRSYDEALAVYNARVWSATATLCRRTLEGMIHYLAGKASERTSLAKMLESLPEKIDLSEPVRVLADSVRQGGNIGAHFDSERLPDQKLARTMIDLLEYLLEFFFTLPRLIEEAKKVLEVQSENEARVSDSAG